MPRVFITGGFGYLGLALAAGLPPDWHVVVFGHKPRSALAYQALPARVKHLEGDLLGVRRVLQDEAPFDAVLHLAGGGGPKKIEQDPGDAIRSNLRGTSELIAAAREAGIPRLIFASTIAVYGTYRESHAPYREQDVAIPDDLYGITKEAAEHVWTHLGGGHSLRLANVYGAGAGVDLGVSGAVEHFARAAARGGELRIFGSGEQRIDYVHVADVVDAFRLATEASDLPPVLNIGGGAPISIAELAQVAVTAGREIGASPHVGRVPAPEGKSWPDRSLAIELARETLGWKPARSYDEGIRELVAMMKELG